MKWKIEYYNQEVQSWIDKLPVGIKASYARLSLLLTEFGMDLRFPHSKSLGSGLFELRPKGKEGIARVFYCTVLGRRIVILHGFFKKTQKIPRQELEIAIRRLKEIKNASSEK